MRVGTVKEIKNNEYRVGLTPNCVHAYVEHGHTVLVEKDAGIGSGFANEDYIKAGAKIVDSAASVWQDSDMIVKVKEPIAPEYKYLREGLILYTYLHLAADKPLTDALLENKVKAVAYETITDRNGGLPCLAPMSVIAGRLSIQEGAKYLEKTFGGRGVLIGGVPGVSKAEVVVIGGGTVGTNACKMAVGMGARVTVLDTNLNRLSYLDDVFGGHLNTIYSSRGHIIESLKTADLVIGSVLIPGKAAPKLVKREDIKLMKKGAVMVDVAVDQGGCFETTHPTTHEDPIFEVDGVVQYCVANMPGAVPRTGTLALTATTLQGGLKLAGMGCEEALKNDKYLKDGLNCYNGHVTCPGVAQAYNMELKSFDELV